MAYKRLGPDSYPGYAAPAPLDKEGIPFLTNNDVASIFGRGWGNEKHVAKEENLHVYKSFKNRAPNPESELDEKGNLLPAFDAGNYSRKDRRAIKTTTMRMRPNGEVYDLEDEPAPTGKNAPTYFSHSDIVNHLYNLSGPGIAPEKKTPAQLVASQRHAGELKKLQEKRNIIAAKAKRGEHIHDFWDQAHPAHKDIHLTMYEGDYAYTPERIGMSKGTDLPNTGTTLNLDNRIKHGRMVPSPTSRPQTTCPHCLGQQGDISQGINEENLFSTPARRSRNQQR